MLLFFSTIAFAMSNSFQVTPTQKVVQLLSDMVEKGKAEKHAETVQFATYKQFCEDTAGKKQRAIKAGNRRADSLRAAIAKNEADAKRLGNEIAAHDEDISVWDGDKKAAHRVREIESANFRNLDKDYSESLDALERAIAVLQKQNYDRAQSPKKAAEALMQIRVLIPAESKHVIDTFLAEDPDNDAAHLAVEAPDAHGYEFQSKGVIDLLAKLKNKFDSEREKLRKEEANSKQAFNLLQQSLANQIDEATRQRDEKAKNRATKLQKKGDDTADLSDTIATRDDDQKYLTDMTATCEQKASDFEKRQQLRSDEIEALEKALEILSSDAVKGAAEKHLPQFVEKATSFVQLRSARQTKGQERAVLYLKNQADRIHSRVLSALAVRVADDPFHKVKKLIKDLIVRLMEEAAQETEKKGWCDTELTNNAHSRKEKTNKVENLHATVDQLKTSVTKLSEDITQLTQEVLDLDKAVAQATDLRATDKAKNEATIKDAQEAQQAVARALAVLQEFYAKAGESTALVQVHPEAPEIFDSPYQGQQTESGGVISMLDVIQSDFARLEAETISSEKSSQTEHEQFLKDSEVDKTQKAKDIEHKSASREDQKQLLGELAEGLVDTQKELDAANAYYDQLKPQCIQSGANYEERASRREEEIESLQEALRILNSEDLA